MHLREFYARTLPATGIYTLWTSGDKRNLWVDSVDDLVEQTEALQDRTDCYYAVASFLHPGDEYTGRTQDNVDQLKCFRLDLDAGEKKLAKHGPEKVYATQRDALADLVRFTKDTGLVFSVLVSSGEGLHVYYELDAPTIPEAWRPVARQFGKFSAARGLKVDGAVTASYQGVLRPIGTLHPNGSRVSVLKVTPKVYSLEDFADAVGHVAQKESAFDLSINDDVLAVQGPPKSFKKIVMRCAAMREAYVNQAGIPEPYWRSAIGVCKHTVEGREAAHAISSRHPEYDADKTDEKFDRWEAGPSTCERFAEEGAPCAGCEHRGVIKSPIQLGLMNVQEVEKLPEEKRPAPAAPTPAPGKPWDGCLTPGFDVKEHKGVLTLTHDMTVTREDADGQPIELTVTVPITHDVFWFGQWADAHDSDDTAQVVVHKMDRSIKRSYLMEQTLVASRADLTKYLASKGIHLTTDKRAQTAMEAYAKAQLQRIKSALQRPKITDRFGLRILEDGTLVCAHGKFLIYPDGRIEEAMLSKGLRGEAEHYRIPLPESESRCWDGSVWKSSVLPSARAHVDFMRRYYGADGLEKYQLAIMLGLASPLMAFSTTGYWKGATLPPNGLSIALFSENGGRGKTTAMQCAQLAFGLPSNLNKDNDDLNTTALARLSRFSMSGTMPVNMDEMGDMDAKALATLVRTIANGSGRQRATKDGGLNVSSPWSLICLIGTNKSQREIIAHIRKESSAEQFRLLELDVEHMPKFGVEGQVQFDRDWKGMAAHAGALGALIHLMTCGMGVEKINAFVGEKVAEAARIVQSVRVESASRFQYRALGAMLAVHEMLEKRGLAPFSKDKLVATFLDAYRTACEFVDDNVVTTDGLVLLSKMILDLQPYTIITTNETRRSMRVTTYDTDVRGTPPREAKARFVTSSGSLYVSSDAMQQWCHENKVRLGTVIGAAKLGQVLFRIYASAGKGSDDDSISTKRWSARFNLFKGMRESTGGQVSCYGINVNALGKVLGDDLAGDLVPVPEAKVVQLHGDEVAA